MTNRPESSFRALAARKPANDTLGRRDAVQARGNGGTSQVRQKEGPPKIGIKIRHARQLMGLSLEELGQRVGLTEGYLSKIENDVAVPSLPALHKLVQELGVNMNSLFGDRAYDANEVFVLRANERQRMETGHRRAGNHIVLEQLVPSGPQYLLQINMHIVEPGGGSPDFISHKGQEFGLVIEGRIELHVEENVVQLGVGDVFYFNSERGHRYQNAGEATARVLWVNTPPTF
jgi:transcriptional regulator with XRE-family HTH domain